MPPPISFGGGGTGGAADFFSKVEFPFNVRFQRGFSPTTRVTLTLTSSGLHRSMKGSDFRNDGEHHNRHEK